MAGKEKENMKRKKTCNVRMAGKESSLTQKEGKQRLVGEI
jgi:hypothetical protein